MKSEIWNITVGEMEVFLEKMGEHAEIWVEIDGKMYPVRHYNQSEDGKVVLKTN